MQVASIKLDTKHANQYAKYLQRAPEIAHQEMRVSLKEALLFLEREVKERTPVGVGGSAGLRGSISHSMRGSNAETVRGRVFSPLRHAIPVEMGTDPHPVSAEGRESIRDWVEKKLGIPESESKQVAFLVARKIAKKGTEGAHMFENALSDNTSEVMSMLYAGIDRLFIRLNKDK